AATDAAPNQRQRRERTAAPLLHCWFACSSESSLLCSVMYSPPPSDAAMIVEHVRRRRTDRADEHDDDDVPLFVTDHAIHPRRGTEDVRQGWGRSSCCLPCIPRPIH